MKYLSNISRIHNILEIDLEQNTQFEIYIDIFVCPFFSCGQQLKVKLLRTENFGTTKYAREKTWDHRNTRKKLGPWKYVRENILYLRNTHEKKFWIHEILTKARWQDDSKPPRSMMPCNPRNLVQSFVLLYLIFLDHVFCRRLF